MEFSEYGVSLSGRERDVLYLNDGRGHFVDVSGVSGLDSVSDGRGAVYADFDNDGDPDVFVHTIQGPAHLLFRNNIGQRNGWIRVSLTGSASGRDAYGATVRMKTSQGIQTKIKSGGEGFLSQHDPRLLFGIGADAGAEWIEVRWPSGATQRAESVAARSHIVFDEATATSRIVAPAPVSVLGGSEKLTASAPNIERVVLHGDTASGEPAKFTAARPTVLLLWATWCSMCREDLGIAATLREALARNGYDVVAASVDEDASAFRDFMRAHRMPFRVMRLSAESKKRLFAGRDVEVPAAVITDGKGGVDQWLVGRSAVLRFIQASAMKTAQPSKKRGSAARATPSMPGTTSGRNE